MLGVIHGLIVFVSLTSAAILTCRAHLLIVVALSQTLSCHVGRSACNERVVVQTL